MTAMGGSTLITVSIIISAILLGVLLVNSLFGPYLSRQQMAVSNSSPSISLLIPVRDEMVNLPDLLRQVRQLDYPDLQIIILDDNSSDGSWDYLNSHRGEFTNLTLLRGSELPPGWTGKNWACWCLFEASRGEIVVFADADTRPGKYALQRSLTALNKYGLQMLSVFPQQILGTWGERMIVPMVDSYLYSALPLWLVKLLPQAALAAANGQWMFWRRDAYAAIGGHAGVKGEVVEDVVMARKAKAAGLAIMTLAGRGEIFTRMYRNFRDVWQGFTKNTYGIAGGTPLTAAIVAAIFLISLWPWLIILISPGWTSFILLVPVLVWRLVFSLNFRYPLLWNVLLYPLQALAFVALLIHSSLLSWRGKARWKGRQITIQKGVSTR
jgi:chlorobactene glucosyltransferase